MPLSFDGGVGGSGATTTATFQVGSAATDALNVGNTLDILVGVAGANGVVSDFYCASGGGGAAASRINVSSRSMASSRLRSRVR